MLMREHHNFPHPKHPEREATELRLQALQQRQSQDDQHTNVALMEGNA
jgi:hypothetical protein